MSRPERVVAADNEVQELVAKARKAQAVYEAFSQEQVDAIVRDMAKYVYDNAEQLARMAVEETGIGNYEDKVLKKKGKARVIWNSLKGKKSRGVIGGFTPPSAMNCSIRCSSTGSGTEPIARIASWNCR